MIEASKKYKRKIKKAQNKSTNKFIQRLRQIKDKDPRTYWNILKGNEKKKCPVLVSEFLKHFKQVAEMGQDMDIEPTFK